ncbi:MAG: ABC transporter, partial [Methylobacteriaceae bacterium]|nr:ABC transporter [Methylobacteriaceae bacterium]
MPDTDPKPRRANLSALKPLLPFATRYKGRIAAAVVALLVASAATLVLPVAARRIIDHGFSDGGGRLIDAYFGVMVGVVAVLAVGSALRFYFVVMLGERIVADLRDA